MGARYIYFFKSTNFFVNIYGYRSLKYENWNIYDNSNCLYIQGVLEADRKTRCPLSYPLSLFTWLTTSEFKLFLILKMYAIFYYRFSVVYRGGANLGNLGATPPTPPPPWLFISFVFCFEWFDFWRTNEDVMWFLSHTISFGYGNLQCASRAKTCLPPSANLTVCPCIYLVVYYTRKEQNYLIIHISSISPQDLMIQYSF